MQKRKDVRRVSFIPIANENISAARELRVLATSSTPRLKSRSSCPSRDLPKSRWTTGSHDAIGGRQHNNARRAHSAEAIAPARRGTRSFLAQIAPRLGEKRGTGPAPVARLWPPTPPPTPPAAL